jgi:hypothetical protein
VVIAAAMMSGQRNIREIAQWAAHNSKELLVYPKPRRWRTASAATLYQVVKGVSVESLEKCISGYLQALDVEDGCEGSVVTREGGCLRG